jgi:Tfp pilus assembly PilM family ATPase
MDAGQFLSRLAKADFADAIGISLGESDVALTHVRKRFNTVTVMACATRPVHVPPEGRWAMIVDFIREFIDEYEIEGARVGVAVDRRDVLIGQLQLPAAAAENLDAVVGYEIDRVIPIPSDQLYVDHYSRPMGTVGERIGITVLGGVRTRIDEVQQELAMAGHAPSAIMPQSVALANYYHFCTGDIPDHPRTAGLFHDEGERGVMTLVHDGCMVASVRFDRERESSEERLRREIENSLPGSAAAELDCVFASDDADEGLRTMASIVPEGVLETRAKPGWQESVAIGAALAELGEFGTKVNLLPPDMIRAEAGVGIREMALSALVVVLAGTLAAAIGFKNLSISNAVASEVERLKPTVSAVNAREEANRSALDRIKVLEAQRSQSVLVYLRDMTDRVPKTAYLTTFRFKGDRVEVDGIADNASGLISLLERSPYFKNVEFTAPTTKYLQSQERFSLRMGLEK